MPSERGTLPTGDYSIQDIKSRVAIERKSVNDLESCLIGKESERFERELARGADMDYFALVIEVDLADQASG